MTAETEISKPDMKANLDNLKTKISNALPTVKDFFVHVVAQVRILKKLYPGLMHALIFWGVTIQIFGTAINLMQMQLFIPFVELPFPRGGAYLAYELVMDLAGIAILLGVSMAIIRRTILRPKSLETQWDDYYALALLALLPLVGFTLEGLRLISAAPEWARWSPVGSLFANIFQQFGMTANSSATLHPYFFWTHVVLGLTFVASIPFTKLRHLIVVPLNIVLRPRKHASVLNKIENIEEAEILGVGKVSEFTPNQLLSFDACVRCGRCEEVCPAAISGMPYSPRTFVQALRQSAVAELYNGNGKQQELESSLPEGIAWNCTTCGACLDRCPAFVNPVEEIIDLRRYQSLTTGKVPKSVADVLRNMERQGNPWGMPAEDRMAWSEGLDIKELAPGEQTDVLFFVGCAACYDARNRKVARSFSELLIESKVDFAVLGYDEMCCGETARRMGHEYLFQVFAEQNIEILSQLKFDRIVTLCPHCFNTLKHEYPQMGGAYPVQHYTEYLNDLDLFEELGSDGNGAFEGKLAYHDSCYLGRYNGIYEAPRELLRQSNASPIEFPRNHGDSFCCGGGGGQMWLETDANTRINHRRLDEVLQVNANTVATACPYCLLMFDDAIRSKGLGEEIQVLDVAELLAGRYLQKENGS